MEIVGILFMVVVAPIWILLHYITRWKSTKTISNEDETLLADLWESAERIDARITNIERILDAEEPGWRKK
ncbi:envelope stress response membrane protein PspB [Pseudemcibacter aquimaris]|uniref:envelope stress response membrane protein PspB n=1 Tax=Pseudemcibacter aquimaris TaxID=2857064 RepID=UPI0020117D12|nr:envelope stress response membrane protein PspB [Pseudemcibacter aquimaris]MCC3861673.1 envelope stress response membrane protein PspB [Pseudemcibacter aquimaris]WDU58444.1 envelope stress response membrane protein PspB [Pseudemcibacter aquimaris]